MAAGTHRIPFGVYLPKHLLSTFEGKYGKTVYKLEAVMERSWKPDLKSKLPFRVNGIVDLNTFPAAIRKVRKVKTKNLCCFWCKSGPISFVLRLPLGGFVPGETVNFVLELSNLSQKFVPKVSVRIMQVSYFQNSFQSVPS